MEKNEGLVFFNNENIKAQYQLVLIELKKNKNGKKIYKLHKYCKKSIYVDELINYWSERIKNIKDTYLLCYKDNEYKYYDANKQIIRNFNKNIKFRYNDSNYKNVVELFYDNELTINYIIKDIKLPINEILNKKYNNDSNTVNTVNNANSKE